MIRFSLFKMDQHIQERKKRTEEFMEQLKKEDPKAYRKMMIARRLHKKQRKAVE